MNYAQTMIKYYSGKSWGIGDTYESLNWKSDEPKPTDEHLKELWVTYKPEYELDQLRNIRNQKLTETDKYTIPDWPQTTEEKETRIKYRQQLRNLPQLYLEKMVGDYSISGEVLYVDDLSYNFFVPIIEEPVAETTEPTTETTEPTTETVTETTTEPTTEPTETTTETTTTEETEETI